MPSDMPQKSWIDSCPAFSRPYMRLMRLDRPIGIWLLWLPCLWGLALAENPVDAPRAWIGFAYLFLLGAVIMRGAGCVLNDLMDHELDARVERTKNRPLPAGEVTRRQAGAFFFFLLCCGLAILMAFPPLVRWLGVASLFLFIPYPLMKRLTYWPQLWLGLTFNWGIFMGYACYEKDIGTSVLFLYGAGIFWTLIYDTIYAHQDKKDDLAIGIKSLALRLGKRTKSVLILFALSLLVCLERAAHGQGFCPAFPYLLLPVAGHLFWQILTVNPDNPENCLIRFKSNRLTGVLILAILIAGWF